MLATSWYNDSGTENIFYKMQVSKKCKFSYFNDSKDFKLKNNTGFRPKVNDHVVFTSLIFCWPMSLSKTYHVIFQLPRHHYPKSHQRHQHLYVPKINTEGSHNIPLVEFCHTTTAVKSQNRWYTCPTQL